MKKKDNINQNMVLYTYEITHKHEIGYSALDRVISCNMRLYHVRQYAQPYHTLPLYHGLAKYINISWQYPI